MTPRVAVAVAVLALAGCTANPAPAPPNPSAPTTGPAPAGLRPGVACQVTVQYGETLPDRHCTPGAVDPAIQTADLCPHLNSEVVRDVTDRTKRQVRDAYGEQRPGEIDHLVSLELGGSNATTNLWPEVGKIPNRKDAVESRLHTLVCHGSITLGEAQQAISTDWIAAYQRFIGPLP